MDQIRSYGVVVLLAATAVMLAPSQSSAAPSAEVARKCMRYSYVVYPYARPGSVKMSGDRQAYFKDCIGKDGNMPEPSPPKEQ